jgi:membrane associated rhomboid family serine protease
MAAPVTTCYRHPDRRAGVTCQRCDKPICPACMSQASVGFQCPDCVAQYRKSSPQALAPWHRRPIITQVLIALNVVAFVAFELVGEGNYVDRIGSGDFTLLGAVPISDSLAFPGVGVAEGEWWRLLTGGFLHGNYLHLGMNMYALWILGGVLERGLGPVRYLGIYFVGLFAGSLGVMLVSPTATTVGASGAVFGLMGATVAVQRSRGIDPWSSGLGGLIVLNLLITFLLPVISVGGHLGGLVGGLAVGALIEQVDRRSTKAGGGGRVGRAAASDGVIAAVAVGLVVLFVAASLVAAQNWESPPLEFLDFGRDRR